MRFSERILSIGKFLFKAVLNRTIIPPIVEVEWIHFETIDSTNAWAKTHAEEFDHEKITCILADTQTGGYGTRGKQWISKKGNLHLTVFFVLSPDDPNIPNLGQLFSFAAAKALPEKVQIKWPNDLIYEEKKLCGVLVETVSIEKKMGVIIGVGMDVNTSINTDQETISLYEITKEKWDIEQLAQVIVHQFQVALKRGFKPIRKEYTNRLAYKDYPIRLFVGTKQIEGILIGLDERGRIEIRIADGSISTFSSGEIHQLRKK